MTLLKNDDGLLPLGRDVYKVAVIGPHANSVMVGFPLYTYPARINSTPSLAETNTGATPVK